MDIQRLRNLTTGKMHTKMSHIYEDLEAITRMEGVMTHMIPRVNDAIRPWLKEHVTGPRFWNDQWDPDHTGDFDLSVMSDEDQKLMLARYAEMPNPLAGKEIIVVEL